MLEAAATPVFMPSPNGSVQNLITPPSMRRSPSSPGIHTPGSLTDPLLQLDSPSVVRNSSALVLAQVEALPADEFGSQGNLLALQESKELPKAELPLEQAQKKPSGGFNWGLLLANASTLCFSLQMLCVKLAAVNGPPSMQLLLVRLVMHTCAVFVCCALGLFGFHGRFWMFESRTVLWLCVATGIVNTIVIQLLYYATTQLSLALATVLYFTSPIWSTVWKTLMLRDTFYWASVVFGSISVVAVALVTLPHEHAAGRVNTLGLISALAAGSLQALAYTIVQVLKRHEEMVCTERGRQVHWLQINLSNAIFGAVLTPLSLWGPLKMQEPMALSAIPPAGLLEMVGLGFFTICAQFLLVQAQAHLDVVLVTVVRTLDVMYALSYQSFFFTGKWPAFSSTVGCVLLVACCAGYAWHARWVTQRNK